MISDGFKARIGKTPITLSMFVDRHGSWAKDWKSCVSVEVQFQDGFAASMTPDDFKGLPTDQQELIRHAPSSPRDGFLRSSWLAPD